MPSSRASTIPYVVYAIKQIKPESLLDVGVGFGKWGYLFRELDQQGRRVYKGHTVPWVDAVMDVASPAVAAALVWWLVL